jgi:hypothetical protein
MPPSRLLAISGTICLVVAILLLASGRTPLGSVLLGVALLDAVLALGALRRERDDPRS